MQQKVTSESQKVLQRTDVEWSPELKEIAEKLEKTPYDGELWLERGHLCARQMMMREAVECYSNAITMDPVCGINYRWRGHRHLNLAEVSEACADFVVASRLIPDNWDVWYHLGLCQVLLGNYSLAELAMTRCGETVTDEEGSDWARFNWTWIALRHQGKDAEAAALLERVPADADTSGPNANYLNMLLFYKGIKTEEELLRLPEGLEGEEQVDAVLNVCTHAFGMANYYLVNGDREGCVRLLDHILDTGKDLAWNCFGYAGATHYRRTRGL